MRKNAGTLAEQRDEIKRKYKRGRRTDAKVVRADTDLDDFEREIKQTLCCYFKAQDFSYSYMAEALEVSPHTVKKWFADNEWMREKVIEIRADLVGGAVKYMKTYVLEIIEGLMHIFRTTDSESIAKEIGFEMLDRLGISKVNKSESAVAKTLREEHDITDKTGLLALAKNAPPHVQAAMAQRMEEILALGSEYAGLEAAAVQESK